MPRRDQKSPKSLLSLVFLPIWLVWAWTNPALADSADYLPKATEPGLPTLTQANDTKVTAALERLDGDLDRLMQTDGMVGLAVSVAHNDTIVYSRALGRRSKASNAAVNPQTRFRIASLSKGFASTLAAQLAAEGKLSLDQPVAPAIGYFALPDPEQTQRARLSHLLSHQVGLPHYAFDNLFDARWEVPKIFGRYGELKQMCPVGTCYGYQNLSFNAVADFIEQQVGSRYEDEIYRRLFEPLQMHSANFGLDGLRIDKNWARPHTFRRQRLRNVAPNENYYRLPAAAGINASLDDMSQWLLAQLGDRPEVLSPALLSDIRAPRVETKREFRGKWRRTRLRGAHYGLGWRIYDYQGAPMIYHAGAVQGYRAQIAVLPEQDIAIVAMWNSESGRPWGITPTFVDSVLGLSKQDWLQLTTP